MNDTSPEFAAIYLSRLMALSPTERLAMASRSFAAARKAILSTLPSGLSDRELKRAIYERTYGEPPPADFPI